MREFRETFYSGVCNSIKYGGVLYRSADHVQDWQPYPVDPYSCCMCDHTNIGLSVPVVAEALDSRGCHEWGGRVRKSESSFAMADSVET